MIIWSRGQDSNLRPLGYEPNELPVNQKGVVNADRAED